MWKRYICLIFLVLIIAATAGCFGGGTPPDYRNQTAKYDQAVQNYNNAKSLYYKGDYVQAKAQFKELVQQFKDNKTAFETILKQDLSGKEKHISENLVFNADQYAYAAAFMRDAADAQIKGDKDMAYAIELDAMSFDQAARLKYEAIQNDIKGL